MKHLAVEPQTRIPWQLTVRPNGDLVYATAKTLDEASRKRLLDFVQRGGAAAAVNAEGGMIVTVPAESRETFFAAMGERNIIDEKHADELPGRVARELERGQRAAEELFHQAQDNGI